MKLKPMAKARSRVRSLERQVADLKAQLAAAQLVEAAVGDGVLMMKRETFGDIKLHMPVNSIVAEFDRGVPFFGMSVPPIKITIS